MFTAAKAAVLLRRPKLAHFDVLMNFEKQVYRGVQPSGLTFSRGGSPAASTDLIWTDPPGRAYRTFNQTAMRFRSGTTLDGLLMEIGPLTNLAATANNPTGIVSATISGNAGTPIAHCVWVSAEPGATAVVTAGTAVITFTGGTNICAGLTPVYFTCSTGGTINITCSGTIYTLDAIQESYPTTHINSPGVARGLENATITNFPIPDVTVPYTLLLEATFLTPDLLNPNPAVGFQVDANVNMSDKLSGFRRVTGGQQLGRAVSDNTTDFPAGPPGNTDMGNDVWPMGVRGRLIYATSPGEQKACFNGGAVTKAFMAHMPVSPSVARIANGLPGANFHAGSAVIHALGLGFNWYPSDAEITYNARL